MLKPLRNSYKKQRQGNFSYILSEMRKEFNVCLVWGLYNYFGRSGFQLLLAELVGSRNIHGKNWVEIKNSPVLCIPSFFFSELHRGDITTTMETFPRETEKSMHMTGDTVFPQQMQQLSYSFCTILCGMVLIGIPVKVLSTLAALLTTLKLWLVLMQLSLTNIAAKRRL